MMNLLKTRAFPSHENGTKVFLRMYILFMLVCQHRTFGIELEEKNRKKEFPQSILVQNTDNRLKNSISSCSSCTVKPDLIPQSEMQREFSCNPASNLSGPRFCKVSCFASGAFNPSLTSHSSTFKC